MRTQHPRDTWTPADQQRLDEMVERRNRVITANMAPLIKLAKELVSEASAECMAEVLAFNADSFRDALEPFDSGVRPAQDNPLNQAA